MEETEEVFYSAEVSVFNIIEGLIQRGAESLYDKYLNSHSVEFSVKSTLSTLSSTIEAFYQRQDKGEPLYWAESGEPAPSHIDTWVRGAVPIKKAPQPLKIDASQTVHMNDAKSATSYTSHRSHLNRLVKSRNRNMKEPGAIEEPIVPEPIPVIPSTFDSTEEALRAQKERKNKKIKEENLRLKKIKEEEEIREKKVIKEAEGVKNKVFTYDCQGKIVFVTPLKTELVPQTYTAVKFIPQEAVVEERKTAVQKSKRRASQEIQPAKRNKTAPMHEQEWVKNLKLAQPPLFESIKLSPGVVYSEGLRVKQSGEAQEAKTMTRREYRLAYQSLQPNLTPFNPALERRSSVDSSIDSELRIHEGKKEYFDNIPEHEGLKSFRALEANASTSLSPGRPSGHGKVVKYGHNYRLSEISGPTERFDAEILKNRSWGINPPPKTPRVIERIPKKASTKELRELYADMVRKPKDNPFISPKELWEAGVKKIKKPRDRPNIERIEKKMRMPPPPYGYTMINVLPELASINNPDGFISP